jgi:hypothetical protein
MLRLGSASGSAKCADDAVHITLDGATTAIALTTTPQPFGGVRRWASCPECRSRCLVLYLLDDAAWSCRRCAGAVYPVTREGKLDRTLRRARRARKRIDADGNLFVPVGALEKPPRMHWRTFERRIEHVSATTTAVVGDVDRAIGRIKRRIRRRRRAS